MGTTTTKSVALRIVADAGTAKETLDRIAQQTDDLEHKKASVTVNVHSGNTKAQLDEITAKANALGIKNVTFKVKADTSQATRKMAEAKAESDTLRGSLLGTALAFTGFGDVAGTASSDAGMFSRVLAGASAATGVLEPALAGLVVSVGGLASGVTAAGVGLGVFGLVAKQVFTTANTAATAAQTAQTQYANAVQKANLKYEQSLNSATSAKQKQAAATAHTNALQSAELTRTQALSTAYQGMSQQQITLANTIGNVKNEWQSFITAATPGVTGVLDKGLGLLPGIFKDMALFLRPVETALTHVIQQVGTGLKSSGFQSFVKELAANTGPAIEKLATAIGHVVVGIGGILHAFMPMSQGVLSGLDKITEKFAKWGTTLSGHSGFQSLMETFKTETPLAVGVLKNLAKILVSVGGAITGLSTPANSKAMLQILEPLTAMVAKFAAANPDVLRFALYMLALASVINKAKGIFTTFGAAIQTVSGLTKVWTGIQAAFNIVMALNPVVLIVVAIAALVAIIVVVTLKSKAFRDFWKDVWRDVSHFFEIAFNFIKSHWELILGILTFPIGGAVLIIVKYWHDIEQGFSDAWHGIASFFSGIWRDIVGGVASMVSNVIGFFRQLGSDIIGIYADAGKWLYDVGRNILIGLWNGIVSMADWVIKQVENFASSLAHAFGWVLKIFSPSKVFWEHGKNIALGVGHGILENANFAVGAVTQLGKSVSNAMSASVGGSAGGTSARGQAPVTNNFNITGIVTNPDSVARQIAQLMNDYNRHNGKEAVFA